MLPGGPPPFITLPDQGQGPSDAPQGGGDAEQQIKAAIDQIRAAVSSDGLSENERLILEKITTLGQQLLAGREKEQQAAMGGGPATQFIKRATQGG